MCCIFLPLTISHDRIFTGAEWFIKYLKIAKSVSLHGITFDSHSSSGIMKIYGSRTQAYVGEQFVTGHQFLIIQFMPFLDCCRLISVLKFVTCSGKGSLAVGSFEVKSGTQNMSGMLNRKN